MLIDEYVEMESFSKFAAGKMNNKKRIIHPDIIIMLENWGLWNRDYQDGLYSHENIIYKMTKTNKGKSLAFIDDEIDVMNVITHEFKHSVIARQRRWYLVLEYYYIGFEVMENGSKFYQRLTDAQIGIVLKYSQKTINNLRHEAEMAISQQIFNERVDITNKIE